MACVFTLAEAGLHKPPQCKYIRDKIYAIPLRILVLLVSASFGVRVHPPYKNLGFASARNVHLVRFVTVAINTSVIPQHKEMSSWN